MNNPGLKIFSAVIAPERPPTHPIWGDINDDVDPERRLDPDEDDSDFMPNVDFGRWRTPGQSIRVPVRLGPPYHPGESPHDVIYGELLTKEDQDGADKILGGDHESDRPSENLYVEHAREDLRTSASRDAVETLSGLLSGGNPQDIGGLDEAHDYLSRHFTGVRVNPHHGTLLAHSPAGTQLAVRKVHLPAIPEVPEQQPAEPTFALTNKHGTFESPDPKRIIRTMVAFQIVHNELDAERRRKKEEESGDSSGLTASSGFVHDLFRGGLGKQIVHNLRHGVPAFTVPKDAIFEPGHGIDQNEKGQRGGWVSSEGLPGWHHDPNTGIHYSPGHSMGEMLDPERAKVPWPDPDHAGHTYTYAPNPETGHTIERRGGGITYFVNKLHPAARKPGFDVPKPIVNPTLQTGRSSRPRKSPASPVSPAAITPKKSPPSPASRMPKKKTTGSAQANDLCPVCASGYLEPYDHEFHECLNCGSLVKHIGFERHEASVGSRDHWSRELEEPYDDSRQRWNVDAPSSHNIGPEPLCHVTQNQHDLLGELGWVADRDTNEYLRSSGGRIHVLSPQGAGGWLHSVTDGEDDKEFGAIHPDLGSAMNAFLDVDNGVKPQGSYRRVAAVKRPGGLGRGLKDIGPYEGDPLNLASGGSENPENEIPEGDYVHPLSGEEHDPDYVGYEAPKRMLDKSSAETDHVDEHMGKLGFMPIHKPGQARTYAIRDPHVSGAYYRVTEGASKANGEPSGWALTADHFPARERWTQNGEDFPERSLSLQRRTVQPGKPAVFRQPLPDPGERVMGNKNILATGTHPVEDDSFNRAIRDVAKSGRNSATYQNAFMDTAYEPPRPPVQGPNSTQRDLRLLSSLEEMAFPVVRSNPGLVRFVG